MKDKIVLIVIIAACIYFAVCISLSPAPLWLVILVDIVFTLICLGCLDAMLALAQDKKGARR